MPTVVIDGYVFRFYSSDRLEPAHVHVLKDRMSAKVWLRPVMLKSGASFVLLRSTRADYQESGMRSSTADGRSDVEAVAVQVDADRLCVSLSDARQVILRLKRVPWLSWLLAATPEERANWTIEPGGFAIYWPDLDDDVEVEHLLDRSAIA